jgi:glycosyltransferase involved in cell wall biosynthesis
MLRRCLTSLRSQVYDATRLHMQVIVVDNNPEPSAWPIHDELFAGRCGYVHWPIPGIPVARNAALAAALRAGAAYIAFLDDDEVAPAHWLRSLVQALEASGADAVQGGVRRVPADAIEAAAACAAEPEGKIIRQACESLATCNVLFKARLVEPPLALRFDETMQFTGGSDREFFMRARQRGAKLLHIEGVDVFEDAHESRQTLGYQAVRAFAAGSNYFARMAKNEPVLVAAARIAMRAVDRGVTGVVKLAGGAVLLLAARPRAALRQWRKGCVSLCFAAGCVTPVAGVRAYPYRNIQGA